MTIKSFVSRRAALCLLAWSANLHAETQVEVPEALRPPPAQTLFVEAQASGVQIYECSPGKESPQAFEWIFKAPEAALANSAGEPIGKHYAGPSWESSDGSKVTGELVARAESPDAASIPWLRLRSKAVEGPGILSRTESILRVNTKGGKAPKEPCGQANAQQTLRVPYSATYYFYTSKP